MLKHNCFVPETLQKKEKNNFLFFPQKNGNNEEGVRGDRDKGTKYYSI